jgi:hypothetical protein
MKFCMLLALLVSAPARGDSLGSRGEFNLAGGDPLAADAQLTAVGDGLWLGVEPTYILLAIGVVGLVTVLFKADDNREERRMAAIEASGDLKAIGLDKTAYLAAAYAVGDYSGIVKAARDLIGEARGRGGADAIARDVVVKALPGLLRSAEFGPSVRQAIADAQAGDPLAPHKTAPLGTAPLDTARAALGQVLGR